MRILLLAQVLPYPPDSGPKVKTYGTVRALAAQHDLTVLAFSRSVADEARSAQLAACGCTVVTVPLHRGWRKDLAAAAYAMFTTRSFLLARDRRQAMHQMVREQVAQQTFDAIHVDQLNMAQYVPRGFPGRVIFDAHNAVWLITERMAANERHLFRRLALRIEARRIQRAEGNICRSADIVLTTSAEDRTALSRASSRPFQSAIIPIGVEVPPLLSLPPGNTPMLLHVGTMFYPPNADAVRWFVSSVFDRVRAAVPDVRFVIIGARPPADIVALHDPERGIEVCGYVDDIASVLAAATATVVPTRAGSGMRVKILEAMAVGLPVVTTTVGAEGITIIPEEHLLIGDDAEAFADATIRVLSDATLRERLRANAYGLAAARYDWRVCGALLCNVYDALDDQRPARSVPSPHASIAESVLND